MKEGEGFVHYSLFWALVFVLEISICCLLAWVSSGISGYFLRSLDSEFQILLDEGVFCN